MDIFSLKIGDKLKCISNNPNTWGGCTSASDHLVIGKVYVLSDIEIHSWHTKLWFEELSFDLMFNSVHFEKVGEEV